MATKRITSEEYERAFRELAIFLWEQYKKSKQQQATDEIVGE